MSSLKLAFLVLTSVSALEVCNKGMKQGPFKIRDFEMSPPIMIDQYLDVTVFSTDYEELIIVGYKSYYQSYAYQGGPLDSNTRVEEKMESIALDRDTLLDWDKKEQCEVGEDLFDQWGSDSDKCLGEVKGKGHWYPTKEIIRASNNNHFAHHTCNRSWRCGISRKRLHTTLHCDNSENCTVRSKDVSGNWVWFEYGKVYKSNGVYITLKNIPKVSTTITRMKCLHSLKDNQCQVECMDGNNMVELVENVYNCEFNKCYYIESLNCTHPDPPAQVDDSDSATKGDLKKLHEMVKVENYALRFDLHRLHNHLNKMSNIMHSIISSVAKIDEKLIGNILNSSISTRFISNDLFFTYPCSSPIKINSNCMNGSIYKDGRWVENKDPSECLELSNYKEIEIDDDLEFWVPTIGDLKQHDTWRDSEGWSFIAQQKENLANTMEFTKWGGKTTSLEDIVNMPKDYLTNKLSGLLFGNIFSYIFIIIVGVILFKVFKRI